ncbi:PH domain-containing protein [Salinibacterium sp. SYSU T00001]|uniref:PH domain-containing protein n=1 Tax=Homoserinimonas sedimenticola TaxID=2986805 RepID=UPI00223609EA|nr:PH domain-containing protein [Salinibacterium sedimenticola]MCW4385402.1 PH domain-containing protein [Salinibacterium sedimenticola]
MSEELPQQLSEGRRSATAASLADGEWHRLHRASPLLKGGIALIAILGVVITNMRERLIQAFVPQYTEGGDPVDFVFEGGLVGWALLAVAIVLVALLIGFWASWRMHTFRITEEVVEVRSGIVFRTHRRARLDRIQGINIARPFIPRLFGAARLEISQAGQDANVQLAYLGSTAADELRREILRLASGTREQREARIADASGGSLLETRVGEFLAPELDPDEAPPESIVRIGIGRLIGSVLLSTSTLVLIGGAVAIIVVVITTDEWGFLFGLVPAVIGFGSYWIQRFTRTLRYSIAGTRDGVRVGYGLLSTTNETLPPGRIHSVVVDQPLLWRAAGWWEIKVNRASQATAQNASAAVANTTILPVGDHQDVMNVLRLLLPDLTDLDSVRLIEAGMAPHGRSGDGFVNSPRRAAWLRWFSWRRNGFAVTMDAFFLRRGAVWRELVIVPAPRVQSTSIEQGPLGRMTRLATVHLHTVAGPITARLGAVDVDAASAFFAETAGLLVDAAARDRSHRWGASDSSAESDTDSPVTPMSSADSAATPAEAHVEPRREEGPGL